MSIEIIGVGTPTIDYAAQHTPQLPAGIVIRASDVILIFSTWAPANAYSAPSGWESLIVQQSTGAHGFHAIWGKMAGSSAPAMPLVLAGVRVFTVVLRGVRLNRNSSAVGVWDCVSGDSSSGGSNTIPATVPYPDYSDSEKAPGGYPMAGSIIFYMRHVVEGLVTGSGHTTSTELIDDQFQENANDYGKVSWNVSYRMADTFQAPPHAADTLQWSAGATWFALSLAIAPETWDLPLLHAETKIDYNAYGPTFQIPAEAIVGDTLILIAAEPNEGTLFDNPQCNNSSGQYLYQESSSGWGLRRSTTRSSGVALLCGYIWVRSITVDMLGGTVRPISGAGQTPPQEIYAHMMLFRLPNFTWITGGGAADNGTLNGSSPASLGPWDAAPPFGIFVTMFCTTPGTLPIHPGNSIGTITDYQSDSKFKIFASYVTIPVEHQTPQHSITLQLQIQYYGKWVAVGLSLGFVSTLPMNWFADSIVWT
jgi:hypothetical protein